MLCVVTICGHRRTLLMRAIVVCGDNTVELAYVNAR
jgi:hypothetical protein